MEFGFIDCNKIRARFKNKIKHQLNKNKQIRYLFHSKYINECTKKKELNFLLLFKSSNKI